MSRTLLFFVACTASACGVIEYSFDGGPGADASGPTGRIEVESERSLALVFGEVSEIEVRYTEDGAPVRGAIIRFALEGRAHDSSVSELSVMTDDEGRARTSLVAASTAAVFRVRITAERAAPAYVEASVGNMGFGSLRVSAVYAGDREGGTTRAIGLYSQMRCGDELPPSFDRSIAIDDPEEAEARFSVLPAGILYAVVGRVLGPTGATLAASCVDGVPIVRDEETRVELTFTDEPLLPAGRYALGVSVDSAVSSGAAVDLAIAAGAAHVDAAGSTAALYLDALDAELRYRGEIAAADLLSTERLTGAPDAALTARLDGAGVDLVVSLLELGVPLGERLRTIGITGSLSLTMDAGTLSGSWTDLAITLGREAPDSPPLALEPDALGLAATMTLGWRADADALDLEALELSLPLGSLAAALFDGLVRDAALASPGALIEERAGCEVLAEWVADPTTLALECDAACARAACLRALDGVIEAARVGLEEADASRDVIELAGPIALSDDDADAVVDRMTAAGLEGTWAGPLGYPGDALRAELEAVRAAE